VAADPAACPPTSPRPHPPHPQEKPPSFAKLTRVLSKFNVIQRAHRRSEPGNYDSSQLQTACGSRRSFQQDALC